MGKELGGSLCFYEAEYSDGQDDMMREKVG
jgi:hypothetical protein